jgi:hypothetical protein
LGGRGLKAPSPDAGAAGERIKLRGIRGRDACWEVTLAFSWRSAFLQLLETGISLTQTARYDMEIISITC